MLFTCMMELVTMHEHHPPFGMNLSSHICPRTLSVPSSEHIMSAEAIVFIILQIYIFCTVLKIREFHSDLPQF